MIATSTTASARPRARAGIFSEEGGEGGREEGGEGGGGRELELPAVVAGGVSVSGAEERREIRKT